MTLSKTPIKQTRVNFENSSSNIRQMTSEIEIPTKLRLNIKHQEEELCRINDYDYSIVIKDFRQYERIKTYKKKLLVPIKKQNKIWKDNQERYKYKKEEINERRREELEKKMWMKEKMEEKGKEDGEDKVNNEYRELKNSRKVTAERQSYSSINKQSKVSYRDDYIVKNQNISNEESNEKIKDIDSKLLKNQEKYKNQIEKFRLDTEKTVFERIKRRIQIKKQNENRKKKEIVKIHRNIEKRHKENMYQMKLKEDEKVEAYKGNKLKQYENWYFQIEKLKKERMKKIRKNKQNKENFEYLIKKTEEKNNKLKEEIELHLKSSEERRNRVFQRNQMMIEEKNMKRRELERKAMMNKLGIDENERKYREYVSKKQVDVLKSAMKMRFDVDLSRSAIQEKIILERMLIEKRLGLYESNIYHLQDNSILKKSVEKRKEMYKDILRKEYEKKKAEEEKLKNGE